MRQGLPWIRTPHSFILHLYHCHLIFRNSRMSKLAIVLIWRIRLIVWNCIKPNRNSQKYISRYIGTYVGIYISKTVTIWKPLSVSTSSIFSVNYLLKYKQCVTQWESLVIPPADLEIRTNVCFLLSVKFRKYDLYT